MSLIQQHSVRWRSQTKGLSKMIKKEQMKIISNKRIATETIEMILENKYISENAVPGQFLHITVIGHTLRRPISIASVDADAQTVTILFKELGDGTRELATYQPGTALDVLGPAGNGFPIDKIKETPTALLIGGGIGVPPVYFLAKTLKEQGVNVKAIIGFQSNEFVFYEEKFKQLGETYVVTNDGSYGDKGFVTDIIDKVGDFDRYFSCGPSVMLQAVTNKITNKEGYLSFEERMGCGVGACFACVIPAENDKGYLKICQDGPVFAANEVLL